MTSDDVPESVTLECSKTGREYEADVTIRDGESFVDASCPYCENRGLQAVADDLRRDLEELERRIKEGDDAQ